MTRVFATLSLTLFLATAAFAGGGGNIQMKQVDWHFDGHFGTFDRQSIQRGFQVYKEVCSACHGLRYVSYRDLMDIGFSEAEVKAIAAEKEVTDGPNDEGDMFERPARPSDKFVSPFANEQASRAANGGAYPVDLSLIVKARPNGANYLYSLLTGYDDLPADFELASGMTYNSYFEGNQIAMVPPLVNGTVDYIDGTDATLEQQAKDIVNFLHWAAEPEMEQRKSMGVKVLLFLAVFTILFYLAKKRVWGRIGDSN